MQGFTTQSSSGMPACKQCGACLWDTAEVKGGPNAGRQYSKCKECGKFGAFVDGQPSLKPKEGYSSTQYGAPNGPFESKASFQSPAYSPPGKTQPIPIPQEASRHEYLSDDEPPKKRARFTDGFSDAMLNVLAGVGTLIKRFDQAAATLEKLAVALKEKDAEGNPKD